jgi:hypothetical protein
MRCSTASSTVRAHAHHLIRLCRLLERDGDPRIGQAGPRSKALENVYKGFPHLEPPSDRGAVTTADVHGAPGPQEHAERVRRWARSVWQAWSAHHNWARECVRRL